MYYVLIPVFIIFFACNSKKASEDKIQVIDFGCDAFISKYSSLDPCQKLKLVEDMYPLNNSCYEFIGEDMYKLTHISYSMSAGNSGFYYSSDSLLKRDLQKWSTALKCSD